MAQAFSLTISTPGKAARAVPPQALIKVGRRSPSAPQNKQSFFSKNAYISLH
jgi:hypothetical protein